MSQKEPFFKDRQLFLTSVLGTSLLISGFKIYNKSGEIDQEALKGFTELVSASFDDTEKLIIKKPNEPIKCDCNGAKIIVHGDGHRTPCPCTGTTSGCQCGKSQAAPAMAVVEQKSVKIFTRPNCVWCDKWKNEQKKRFADAGWILDEGYGEGVVPFFEIKKGNKKVVKVGFTTLEEAERIVNE